MIMWTFFVVDSEDPETWLEGHIEVSNKDQPRVILPPVTAVDTFLKEELHITPVTVLLKQRNVRNVPLWYVSFSSCSVKLFHDTLHLVWHGLWHCIVIPSARHYLPSQCLSSQLALVSCHHGRVAEWLARRTHWSCWRHGEREVVSSIPTGAI